MSIEIECLDCKCNLMNFFDFCEFYNIHGIEEEKIAPYFPQHATHNVGVTIPTIHNNGETTENASKSTES